MASLRTQSRQKGGGSGNCACGMVQKAFYITRKCLPRGFPMFFHPGLYRKNLQLFAPITRTSSLILWARLSSLPLPGKLSHLANYLFLDRQEPPPQCPVWPIFCSFQQPHAVKLSLPPFFHPACNLLSSHHICCHRNRSEGWLPDRLRGLGPLSVAVGTGTMAGGEGVSRRRRSDCAAPSTGLPEAKKGPILCSKANFRFLRKKQKCTFEGKTGLCFRETHGGGQLFQRPPLTYQVC